MRKPAGLTGFLLFALPLLSLAEAGSWYGGLKGGYLYGYGDAELFGPTRSVYGELPAFDLDDGGHLSISLGFRWPSGWRLEGELAASNLTTAGHSLAGSGVRDLDVFRLDSEIETTTFMLNAYREFDVLRPTLWPYLRAGIGATRNEASGVLFVDYGSAVWDGTPLAGLSGVALPFPADTETALSWTIGAGVRSRLTEHAWLSVEYGFVYSGEATTGLDENGDAFFYNEPRAQRLLLALDYRF